MRVGIIVAFVDYHRKGNPHRGVLQPQIGPLIAALLPEDVDIEVINDTWEDPDWSRDYDLVFISCLHSDFDRARQISHYWRARGAMTVFGGTLASTYTELCLPFFDAVIVGDPEQSVPRVFDDFVAGKLRPVYVSAPYDPQLVPTPRFDLLARKQMVPLSLEATRGCPFACEFCVLSGVGTRYHTRPPELVLRDVLEGRRMLRGLVSPHKLKWVVFNDNNIGGNIPWLRQLCAQLKPHRLRWGSAITFNVVANREMVELMSEAGCRFLFTGLESFNPEVLSDMHKVQNAVEKTKAMIDQCRENGIVIVSGVMLSPIVDTAESIAAIPGHLRACGLHVPSFVCFESPFPGTPHFHRLIAEDEPALLPNALLRDFNGYTLVTRPRRETLPAFIAAFRRLAETVWAPWWRTRKVADDLSRFARGGYLTTSLVDTVDQMTSRWSPNPHRTFVAGTDVEPPEHRTVPLSGSDFSSEAERRAVMEPMRVTDERGVVLPHWRGSTKVYGPRGAMASEALAMA